MVPYINNDLQKSTIKNHNEHGAAEGSQMLPFRKGFPVENEILNDIESVLGRPVELLSEIANNGKCLVWEAKSPVGVVALKTLITEDEFYVSSFRKEAIIYSAFNLLHPGAGVPKAHYVSHDSRTIVLEFIAGNKLSENRYPKFEINDKYVMLWRDLRGTVESLRTYSGYELGSRENALERYRERWDKYIKRGVYLESDQKILDKLERTLGWKPEFNHGDPVPSNILLGTSGQIHLIDWEFGGSYIPFYDIAVLWAISINNSIFQDELEKDLLSRPEADRICFAANVLNVASREVWIHRDLPDGHEIKEDRLKLVEPLLDKARKIVDKVLE